MHRSHLIRLYPNEQQKVMLAKTAGVARYCYNWGLSRWQELRKAGKYCSVYEISKMWTKEKPEWASEVNKGSQTQAFLNLGKAFKLFFDKKKDYPTYHKKGVRDSFYVTNDHAWFNGEKILHLPKIGNVRLAEKLRYNGKILKYTVSRKADFWFVSVSVELPNIARKVDVSSAIGVDVGSKHWATTSDGNTLERPRQLAKLEKRLKHLHRAVSRKKLGSNNRKKALVRAARMYLRITNVKLDTSHKFTASITKNHSVVCCETLNLRGVCASSVKGSRKAVVMSFMGGILNQLKYKAAKCIQVGMFYPSSKTCSSCGHKRDDLTLNDRIYRCPACGAVIDRDLNAAINIRNEGIRIFTEGHSGSACGGR